MPRTSVTPVRNRSAINTITDVVEYARPATGQTMSAWRRLHASVATACEISETIPVLPYTSMSDRREEEATVKTCSFVNSVAFLSCLFKERVVLFIAVASFIAKHAGVTFNMQTISATFRNWNPR